MKEGATTKRDRSLTVTLLVLSFVRTALLEGEFPGCTEGCGGGGA